MKASFQLEALVVMRIRTTTSSRLGLSCLEALAGAAFGFQVFLVCLVSTDPCRKAFLVRVLNYLATY